MRPSAPKLIATLVFAVAAVAGLAILGLSWLAPGNDPGSIPEAEGKGVDVAGQRAESSTGDIDPTPQHRSNTTSPGHADSSAPLEVERFESDDAFWWIWAEPAAIRMAWTDDSTEPFGQLELARRSLEANGATVIAITNGGIYQPGLVPAGLYIEDGRELRPLNRADGDGNFHLLPNGVFSVSGVSSSVATTADFVASASAGGFDDIDYALQSGPMLVIDGVPNPLFTTESASVHIRNAVGVAEDGRVLLIRSRRAVTMRQLADQTLELGAVNVLYLDGSLSRLDAVQPGRAVLPNIPVASMIAVVEVEDASRG